MEGSYCSGVVEVICTGVFVNINQNWKQVPHGQVSGWSLRLGFWRSLTDRLISGHTACA